MANLTPHRLAQFRRFNPQWDLEQWNDQRTRLQDHVLDEILKPGGGTWTNTGNRFQGSGYLIADPYLMATGITNKNQLAMWLSSGPVAHALLANRLIGTWTDPETMITEVSITDIIRGIDPSDRIIALVVGRQRMQKAIGYIINGEYQGDITI